MKTRSKKNKGRLGCKEIVAMLEANFPEFLGDFTVTPSGVIGKDITCPKAFLHKLPIQIEVKRKKEFRGLCKIMEQCYGHGAKIPVVFIREDHMKDRKKCHPSQGTWFSCVPTEFLLQLLLDVYEYKHGSLKYIGVKK